MLRFIIILLAVIYLGGLISKWIVRRWLKNFSNKNSYQKKKEGEVSIKYTQPTEKKIRKEDGEYVDYEEVK